MCLVNRVHEVWREEHHRQVTHATRPQKFDLSLMVLIQALKSKHFLLCYFFSFLHASKEETANHKVMLIKDPESL